MVLKSGYQVDDNVVDMFHYKDYVCLVTENEIYGYMLSESNSIDLNNESKTIGILDSNPLLFHKKKLLGMGSGSVLVSRSYLTARKLFKNDRLEPFINCQKALELSFDALLEMAEMLDEVNGFVMLVANADKNFEYQRKMNLLFEIPSIPNVTTKCKTIFQKAEHTCQILMNICQLFYPELTMDTKAQFSTLLNSLESKYGINDNFIIFCKSVLPTIQLVRDIRNCLDHRLKEIEIWDYDIDDKGNLMQPGIALNYRKNTIRRTDLSPFLQDVMAKIISMFEGFVYYLSLKGLVEKNSCIELKFIPLDHRRRNKFIQYGYWVNIGGGIYE